PAAPAAAPQEAWGSPAPAAPQDAWGTPAPAAAPGHDAWSTPAPTASGQDAWSSAQSSEPTENAWAPGAGVAEETSGAPWDEVDARARAPGPAHQDVGADLEATRLTAIPPAPARPRLTLRMDDGIEISTDRPVVVGRNPAAGDAETSFIIKDDTRSVSKTH